MSANKSLIFGLHPVESLLTTQPERIIHLYILKERHDKKIASLIQLAKKSGIAVDQLSRKELDKMTDDENHQGVVALCSKPKVQTGTDLNNLLENLTEVPFLLVLDGVQDPHNLGACFRSADAAGVHAVIVPKDNSVGITSVVSKVACGATETVPFFQVTNLARTLGELKERGIWIYGAVESAEKTLFQTDLSGPVALVLGSEGSGLRRLTQENCDQLMQIPMRGAVSSLNVSVATGICLFEVVRQRI